MIGPHLRDTKPDVELSICMQLIPDACSNLPVNYPAQRVNFCSL
jgi:hypothetical protein